MYIQYSMYLHLLVHELYIRYSYGYQVRSTPEYSFLYYSNNLVLAL